MRGPIKGLHCREKSHLPSNAVFGRDGAVGPGGGWCPFWRRWVFLVATHFYEGHLSCPLDARESSEMSLVVKVLLSCPEHDIHKAGCERGETEEGRERRRERQRNTGELVKY